MQAPLISPSTLVFLKKIKKNNNRDWFAKNKGLYETAHQNVIDFAEVFLHEMQKHDKIETASGKKSIYRIYRDVRFSKDKLPFKSHFGGSFSRATKKLRGGYYFHIEPGNSFLGGGFWQPNPEDLKRIRDEFALDAKEIRKILKSKSFVDTFGTLDGEQLKTAPRGFDPALPNIDLIKYKQFLISKHFTDKEVLSKDFLKNANDTFKKMRPFFNYMSEVLSTDINGEDLF